MLIGRTLHPLGKRPMPVRRLLPISAGAPPLILPNGFTLNGSANTALKAMMSGVNAGTRRGKIVIISDSTYGAGQGAGIGSPYYLQAARPKRVASVMAGLLGRAVDNAIIGDNAVSGGAAYNLYDPRMENDGAGFWTYQSQPTAPGAGFQTTQANDFYINLNGLNADSVKMVFADKQAITLYYRSDNDGQLHTDTTTLTGSGTFKTINTTFTRGNGHFTIATGGGNQVAYLTEFYPFDSTAKLIDFKVHGGCGVSSKNFTDSTGLALGALPYVAAESADLYIVALGINDYNTGLTTAQHIANLTAILNALPAGASVLLVTQHGTNLGTPQIQADYAAADAQLAASRGIAYLSVPTNLGPFSGYSNQLVDQIHGNAPFDANIANLLVKCIQPMAG